MNVLSYLMLFVFLAACSGKKDLDTATNTTPEEFNTLVWSDEFDYTGLPDSTKWGYRIGNGCQFGPYMCGWGNNELQYYTKDSVNAWVEDGKLTIELRQEQIEESEYSSASLITKDKQEWKYGRFEIKAKLPEGLGTWPAIWMLPALDNRRWPLDGEIDIMEHVGYNQGMVYGTIHTEKYNGMIGTHKSDSIYLQDATDSFHLYGIKWTEDQISWFVDDKVFYTLQQGEDNYEGWPFDQDYYLLLNVAFGGNWGGKYGVDASVLPQQMEIDYVRVYQ